MGPPGVEQGGLEHRPGHQQDARHKEDGCKDEEAADLEGAQGQLVADLGSVQQRVGCGRGGEGSGRVIDAQACQAERYVATQRPSSARKQGGVQPCHAARVAHMLHIIRP